MACVNSMTLDRIVKAANNPTQAFFEHSTARAMSDMARQQDCKAIDCLQA